MSSIMKILRRIGGAKVTPTSGDEGQLAIWKAGKTKTDASSLFFHDGNQWVEILDTAITALRNVVNTFTTSQVIDVTDTNPALRITQKGTGHALLVEDDANPDATPFVVTTDGKVGVGTNAPQRNLVVSNGGAAGLEINPMHSGGGVGASILAMDRSTNKRTRLDYDASEHNWSANGVEKVHIATLGQFCVNTTAATGDMNVSGTIYLLNQSSGAGTAALKWNSATGLVTYDSSSRLVKAEIVNSPYGLSEVMRLKPRKYYRTDDKRDEVGFIADEVQDVLPEFVPIGPKSLFTGNEADTETIPIGVNYDKLTAVLVKAIQELEARVAKLEART